MEGNIIQIIRKVENVSKDIVARYKNDLVDEMLIEINNNGNEMINDNKDQKKEEIENFVSEKVERIVNYKKVLNGKQTSVRVPQSEIRMAMTIYNRSPVGCQDFRNSSIQILRSIGLLKIIGPDSRFLTTNNHFCMSH